MKKQLQRYLSILCVATMLFGILPTGVFAEETAQPAAVTEVSEPAAVKPAAEKPAQESEPEKKSDPAAAPASETKPAADAESEKKSDPEPAPASETKPAADPEPESKSESAAEPAAEDKPAADNEPAAAEDEKPAAPAAEDEGKAAEPTEAKAEGTPIPVPTVPVDGSLKVGGSVGGKIRKNGTSMIRLTVKKDEGLNLTATGMDLTLVIKNEKTGGENTCRSARRELTTTFSAQAGDYLLTFTAQRGGAAGKFTVKVFEGQPTPVPTAAPKAESTLAPTAKPAEERRSAPTAVPTAEPTASPTAVPTAEPTASPTAAPTAEATAQPTAVPAAKPTEKSNAASNRYTVRVLASGGEGDEESAASVWAAAPASMTPADVKAPEGEYVVEAYLLSAETDCRLRVTGEGLRLYRLDADGALAEDLGVAEDGMDMEVTMAGFVLTAPIEVEVRSSFGGVIRRGGTVTLTAVAHGPANAVFTWECDRGNGFEVVEGATGDTLTFEATAESLKWLWRVSAAEE